MDCFIVRLPHTYYFQINLAEAKRGLIPESFSLLLKFQKEKAAKSLP